MRVRHSPMTAFLLLLFTETRETVDREIFPGFYIVPDTCNKIIKFIKFQQNTRTTGGGGGYIY